MDGESVGSAVMRAGCCQKNCPLQHPNIKLTGNNHKGPAGGTTNDSPLIRRQCDSLFSSLSA